MMLPILISVSVAPMSYFFCASAPVLVAASTANAAEATASREAILNIDDSLVLFMSSLFFGLGALGGPTVFNTLYGARSTKSPLRTFRRGLI
jgi:hypothetical protein